MHRAFLKEQVEELAWMTTLVNIARRADNLFGLEAFVVRERLGDGGHGLRLTGAVGGR